MDLQKLQEDNVSRKESAVQPLGVEVKCRQMSDVGFGTWKLILRRAAV